MTALFIRALMNIVIPAAIVISWIRCDYQGTLVDPDEPIQPLFTLHGSISSEFPDDLFTPSKSIRIGLMPRTGYYNSDAMSDPETYRKYLNEPEYGYSDTFAVEYPAISFTGEFPMNFNSEFKNLPDEQLINRFRGPSGAAYRLGIYAIGLFDDVDKDGAIRMSVSSGVSGGAIYAPGSDRLIGICRDYFIIYLEDVSLLTELNPYIAGHIGTHAVWQGLGAGFNLVALTSEVNIDSLSFTGVCAYPPATGLHIDPIDLTNPAIDSSISYPSMLASYCLFYFQRDYGTTDFAIRMAKIPAGSDTIYLKTWGNRRSVTVTIEDYLKPASEILGITLSAAGIFDQGYYDCSNPMMSRFGFTFGEHFIVNGHSCAVDAGDQSAPDTFDLDGDTLSTGMALTGVNRCGGLLAPVYVDTFVITISVPENASFTVVPVE